jgi:hypothetical protein
MKKIQLALITLCLFCLVACIENPEQVEPIEAPSTNVITPTPPPKINVTPTPYSYPTPKIELPEFDPLNPEGWSIWNWTNENFLYNEGKYLEYSIDDIIGGFYPDMTLNETIRTLPSKTYIKSERVIEGTPTIVKTYTFDNISLDFWNIGSDDEFILMSIELFGIEYETVRGLRVGDTAEKVYELYGIPMFVSDENDTWHYSIRYEYRSSLQTTVVEGVVTRIRISGFP